MISFRCGQCGKDLKVQDALADKKVKCPGCGNVVAVPQAAAATVASQVKPSSPNLEQETIFSPKVPAETEEHTLPATNPGQAGQESLVDVGGQTGLGDGPKEEATQLWVGAGLSPELWDFLAPAEGPDEIGRLGPYRVLQVLGAGGMGVVFRAQDPDLQRLVALKAMLPALASSPSAKERFFREARAAAALKHPHIVTIFQVGEDRGVPFLAMEFLEGEALNNRLKRQRRLPVPEILRIGREIAQGLAAAHEKGLIHRDIKPANIWLEGKQGEVKILDFGLARAIADQTHLTQSGTMVGTPAYMAPEQAGGKAVDHRSDLFSLGCVLYRMCTGEMPFKGNDTLSILSALALANPSVPVSLNAEVPAELSDLVMQLLAKKPEKRPESAQVVVERLQEIGGQTSERTAGPGHKTQKVKGGNTQIEAAPRHSHRKAKKKSRLPWYVGGCLLCLGVLGVVGVLVVLLFFPFRPGDQEGRGQKPSEAATADKKPAPGLPPKFSNTLGMKFVLVPKGKFWMGGSNGKMGDKEVPITHDFYLGTYEVTQEEWEKVTGLKPSHFSRTGNGKETVKLIPDADLKKFPVENVSWDDAQLFLARLNELDKQAGWVYRLPTEAEWEYACRGGPLGNKLDAFDFYFDKPTNQLLPEQANFQNEKDLKRTCKVASYPPNALGLHNMHGNVWEWCHDKLAANPKDPKGTPQRVYRGGSWNDLVGNCRAASRTAKVPSYRSTAVGLRLARVPIGKDGK